MCGTYIEKRAIVVRRKNSSSDSLIMTELFLESDGKSKDEKSSISELVSLSLSLWAFCSFFNVNSEEASTQSVIVSHSGRFAIITSHDMYRDIRTSVNNAIPDRFTRFYITHVRVAYLSREN